MGKMRRMLFEHQGNGKGIVGSGAMDRRGRVL